ncbi:MAG: hypothetical protein IKO72_11715 [Kiritimatiellae bacterium]|nr:hypothetical protein [Kiritimatiellia bacterium]
MGKNKMPIAAIAMVFLALPGWCALNSDPQTLYWTGAQDSFWTNANNWVTAENVVPAMAPGVCGSISDSANWLGHKRDTAIFDGSYFASPSSLTLDVQGLLCIGYVTVQGSTTPEIAFGNARTAAQIFQLYGSYTSADPSVFTIADDVVNMPIIPYPGMGGLVDDPASSRHNYFRFVNHAVGKRFALLGTASQTLDPTLGNSKNPTAHVTFTGEGDFALGGTYNGSDASGINALTQRMFTYQFLGNSSLLVTNGYNGTLTSITLSGEGGGYTNHVAIAAGCGLFANNRGYEQVRVKGNIVVDGDGRFVFLDQGTRETYPMCFVNNAYLRMDVQLFFGSNKYNIESYQTLNIKSTSNSYLDGTLELNNVTNVIRGGIRLDGINLVSSHVDKDANAIGTGPITIAGNNSFIYKGTAETATITNTLNFALHSSSGKFQGTIRHRGSGRLVLAGGIAIEPQPVSNEFSFWADNADSEIEVYGGLADTGTASDKGEAWRFYGIGRHILHGDIQHYHYIWFGGQNAAVMPRIVLSKDVTFTPRNPTNTSLSFRSCDVTFEGEEEGPMVTLPIQHVNIVSAITNGTGDNIIRLRGRRSVKFTSVDNFQMSSTCRIDRVTREQRVYFPPSGYNPTKGTTIRLKIDGYDSIEYNNDGSVRPYAGNIWTGNGFASNGGVLTNCTTASQISQDGTAATGNMTLGSDTVSMSSLTQKGYEPATIALATGQKLSLSGSLTLDGVSADLTVGDVVDRGTLRLTGGGSAIRNFDTNSILTVNCAVEPPSGLPVLFQGSGPIMVNSHLNNKITIDGVAGGDCVVTLNALCSYSSGSTYIKNGTLRLGMDDPLPTESTITVAAGGILDLNDHVLSNPSRIVFQGNGKVVINETGTWTFTAGQTKNYSEHYLSPSAGDKVVVVNAATVVSRRRSRYELARYSELVTLPELSSETQAILGPEWFLVAKGTSLWLQGPICGMTLSFR